MWYNLAKFILRNKVALLIVLLVSTAFMTYKALQVQLGYEFSKAIPVTDPLYQQYLQFKNEFGEDGNVLVIGVEDKAFFKQDHFSAYRQMLATIKNVKGVESLLSVPTALNLTKADSAEQLKATPLFEEGQPSQASLDSSAVIFNQLLFYKDLLHNPATSAFLAGATINREILASKDRTRVVDEIVAATDVYTSSTGIKVQLSGLPLIRTQIADRIKNEMNYFLLGSIVLAAVTLMLFFRSIGATVMSLLVVLMGVAWAVGLMVLFGYRITLLNALIPPLIIVIGVPNCIYFLNKYHMSWLDQQNNPSAPGDVAKKEAALVQMVGKMGVVTLFCNIAAAVGFAVFALTDSSLLKEFGLVSGIAIMVVFFISLIFIPAVLSYMKPPSKGELKYLNNSLLNNLLHAIQHWVLHKKGLVYGLTAAVLVFAIAGIFRLNSVGYIVDDLPKSDRIYTDLKWFEKNFGGVMPLEVVVDTKKKNGITRGLTALQKIDEFAAYVYALPEAGRPLSLVEGLKFAKQAYYDGDSLSYIVPNEFDMAFLQPYLRGSNSDTASQLARLTKTFMDQNRQKARISVNIADVGTVKLAELLDHLQHKADTIFNMKAAGLDEEGNEIAGPPVFDSTYYVYFTGSSVTYLAGSRFIINGLKESILWAFGLIALAMLVLFKNFRILICSLIPNLIPLIITAGVMGWAGIALKPSTVLVFSVALGIAIDITIRFLVNYRQELPDHHGDVEKTVMSTIKHTGLSIIYTSLTLIAGFVIFMFSGFGGTFSLGWLTSLTLVVATATNMILLPVLLLTFAPRKSS